MKNDKWTTISSRPCFRPCYQLCLGRCATNDAPPCVPMAYAGSIIRCAASMYRRIRTPCPVASPVRPFAARSPVLAFARVRVRGARVRVRVRACACVCAMRGRGYGHGGERPGLLAIHLFRLFRQTFGFPLVPLRAPKSPFDTPTSKVPRRPLELPGQPLTPQDPGRQHG